MPRSMRGWRRRADPIPPASPVTTDDAWHVLALVVEWVKHAETKAGATLAAAGVLGGLLYGLVRSEGGGSVAFLIVAGAGATAVVAAAAGAGSALLPRRRTGDPPESLLYYHHVVRRFPRDREAYSQALSILLANPELLNAAIAAQIWANSQVAAQKYWALTIAVRALLVGVTAVTMTAVLALAG